MLVLVLEVFIFLLIRIFDINLYKLWLLKIVAHPSTLCRKLAYPLNLCTPAEDGGRLQIESNSRAVVDIYQRKEVSKTNHKLSAELRVREVDFIRGKLIPLFDNLIWRGGVPPLRNKISRIE